MALRIAVIGAAGKMGTRLMNNLVKEDYDLIAAESGEVGIARLQERGLTPTPPAEAVANGDLIVFAVPDARMGAVTAELIPHVRSGATVIMLDPAAAMGNEVTLREDLHYVVCHPCHPPLFGEQASDEARKDFFGGIIATQDIVIALMQGSEEAFQQAHELCIKMFAPVVKAHRITVEQMAILEPAMAEVVAATAASLMKDALEEAVKAGVPREAATSFMLGHAQIPLAIVFGAIPSPFSDAAKIAIRWGYENVVQPDWRKVFERENLKAVIHEMLHPEEQR